jgi:hypothetical protein
MSEKSGETENRGAAYKPWKRPDQYSQNKDLKVPELEHRKRDYKDNKTA